MKKAYIGTLLTKKGGYQEWAINIDANNLKEAKEELEQVITEVGRGREIQVPVLVAANKQDVADDSSTSLLSRLVHQSGIALSKRTRASR